jgi:poly(A) polymerase
MNALYVDAEGVIADPLGGLPDLYARRVRFIEDADMRIKADYLRLLRCVRFYAGYGDADDGPDREGLAACAANIDGLAGLSIERVTSEMLKLLSAPDPSPAVAAMASTGALMQILPGADTGALAVLVHLEGQIDAMPDAVRRLAVIGGDAADRLRLSKEQARRLMQMTDGSSPNEAAYRFGYSAGIDSVFVQSASIAQPLSGGSIEAVKHASSQVFPLKAADLMPALSGPALGKALKQAEARWIASGFILTKADLIE